MNNLGKPLLIIGVIILIVAFNMDVSVQSGYGRVNNIGLMADRSNYLFFGALLCVAGLILTARNRTAQPGEVSVVSDERKCPFCAKMIKKEAKLCKHCKKELPLASDNLVEVESAEIRPTESVRETQAESLDRSALNKSLTEEFETNKSIAEVRSIIADEIMKYEKRFDKTNLIYSSSKKIWIEALVDKRQANNVNVTINYQEDNLLLQSFMLGFTLIFAVIKDHPYLFWGLLILAVVTIVIKNKLTTARAKKAILAIRSRAEA